MDLLKNLDNMLTAEDLLHKNYFHIKTDLNKTNSYINIEDIYELMIEFAKLHVEEALKRSEEIAIEFDCEGNYDNSILNCYSLEKIK